MPDSKAIGFLYRLDRGKGPKVKNKSTLCLTDKDEICIKENILAISNYVYCISKIY